MKFGQKMCKPFAKLLYARLLYDNGTQNKSEDVFL